MTSSTGPSAGGAAAPEALPVDMNTRFERFPASLKGAFVLRGADGNPHSVRFRSAHIARLPAGLLKPIPIEDRMLDIAPSRDLFVPFEAAVSELDPGWYAVRSAVQVDAGRSFEFSSRAFSIAWPRNDVRRGVIHLRQSVQLGDRSFVIEEVDLASDSATVVWRSEEDEDPAARPRQATVILLADGAALEALPEGAGPAMARRSSREDRTVFYPMPKSARSAAAVIRLAGEDSKAVPIPLG